MPKILVVLSTVMLALTLESCSLLPWASDSEEVEEVEVVETVDPSTVPDNNEPSQATQSDPEPEAESTQQDVAGLVAPTDPRQQRQAIAKGRQDPFDPISVQPTITVNPPEETSAPPPTAQTPPSPPSIPPAPSSSQPNPPSTTPAQPNPPSTTTPTQPPAPAGIPTQPPAPAGIPTQPPAPTAQLARDVVVTGVIEVGGSTKIILKAPEEATSRYVQPGQYVSNGEVLVKGVEFGTTPVVVLEQNGIEVYKAVGETSQPASEEDNPTASLLTPVLARE